MAEINKRIGERISSMQVGEWSDLLLMMEDLMHFDTIPDVYKKIIHEVFESEYPDVEK